MRECSCGVLEDAEINHVAFNNENVKISTGSGLISLSYLYCGIPCSSWKKWSQSISTDMREYTKPVMWQKANCATVFMLMIIYILLKHVC